MSFKILILDDNHSFIDLLKLRLAPYVFRFDTAFRYEQAANQIKKNKVFFSNSLIDQVQNITPELERWFESDQKGPSPKLSRKLMLLDDLTNQKGYSMIIVENRAERVPKGVDFIRSILSMNQDFQSTDFLLFVDNLNQFENEAKRWEIPVFQKDIRNRMLYEFIDKKVAEMVKRTEEINELQKRFFVLRSRLPVKTKPKNKTSKRSQKLTQEPASSGKKSL